VVVSDRFVDSSLAYQGIARDLGVDDVLRISQWATGGVLPDLVLFLNVDPQVGLERTGAAPDRIEAESPGFHARVTEAYLRLAARFPDRFVVIDASRPAEEVQRAVIEAYRARAGDHHDRFAAARDLGAPGPVPR
jgi:dTMP kinase